MLSASMRWLSQFTQSPEGKLWAGADKQALDAIFKEVKGFLVQ